MRRFLTLVCLLGLAIPAGISISGCVRNPQGNYCNGLGYGLKTDQVAQLTLQPQTGGLSLAYGQTKIMLPPVAFTCKGQIVEIPTGQTSWGTTNNQLADISPTGQICAGTWNRNTGGGIADYTYCNFPNPLPTTNGLPYAVAYITGTAASVTSNPVPIYIHAPVTALSLVTTCLPSSGNCASTTPATSVPTQCFSQNQQAQLDALGYYDNNGTQTLLCQPAVTDSVTGSSINAGIVTLTTPANNFIPGENVTFTGLSVAALNSGTYTVLPTGISSTQFQVAAGVPNQTSHSETGSATTSASNPTCGAAIGTLNFASSNPNIARINPETTSNPFTTVTALQPGTITISASVAQSSSLAGYFSTCPPKSIKVSLGNGATSGVITRGVAQNLTTTVIDTNNKPITGLNLSYQSTNQMEVTASGGGTISASLPGVASIYAVCEPPSCNPAPVNEYGLNGTGLSLASNPVHIVVPGVTSTFAWFAAPGKSQYFASIDLLNGNPGVPVRLPYVPNSMLMDQLGINLFFGSQRELMIYSTQNNSMNKVDPTVPGVVLAAAPFANKLLINDQLRGVFYLYDVNAGTSTTFGGMGVNASWTPDGETLYVVDSAAAGAGHKDRLYVFSNNTGWFTSMLACSTANTSPDVCDASLGTTISGGAKSLAVTVPSVGAWLAGNPTVARTWCPSGTVGNNGSILFYPQPASDSLDLQTDALAATPDGQHLLGATLSGANIDLYDIGLAILADPLCPEDTTATPQTMSPLSTNPAANGIVTLGSGATTFNATAVNSVVTSTAPSTTSVTTAAPIAFVTYSGATPGNQLPYYLPLANGSGTGPFGYVTFADSTSATPPTAPLAGAFSQDDSIFFVSTSGDNEIHFISIPPDVSTSNPPVDSQQYSPNLPACAPLSAGGNDPGCNYPTAPGSNTFVPATVIVTKPRSVT